MSVLDQVRALEQQVLQRLRELRPLVTEYRELQKVAERLGLKADGDEAPEVSDSEAGEPTAQSKPAPKRRAKRAPASRAKLKAAAEAKPKPAAKAKTKPAEKLTSKAPAGLRSQAVAEAKPAKRSKSVARGTTAKRRPGARNRSAVAPGQRERDVLRVVGERPGVTVRELAGALGVDATGLYGVVRRLQGKGQLIKDGTELRVSDTPAVADSAAQATVQPLAGPGDGAAKVGEDATRAEASAAGASAGNGDPT